MHSERCTVNGPDVEDCGGGPIEAGEVGMDGGVSTSTTGRVTDESNVEAKMSRAVEEGGNSLSDRVLPSCKGH